MPTIRPYPIKTIDMSGVIKSILASGFIWYSTQARLMVGIWYLDTAANSQFFTVGRSILC